jgi:hypothetical protein
MVSDGPNWVNTRTGFDVREKCYIPSLGMESLTKVGELIFSGSSRITKRNSALWRSFLRRQYLIFLNIAHRWQTGEATQSLRRDLETQKWNHLVATSHAVTCPLKALHHQVLGTPDTIRFDRKFDNNPNTAFSLGPCEKRGGEHRRFIRLACRRNSKTA